MTLSVLIVTKPDQKLIERTKEVIEFLQDQQPPINIVVEDCVLENASMYTYVLNVHDHHNSAG